MMRDVLRGACMVLALLYGIDGLCTCELRDGLLGSLKIMSMSMSTVTRPLVDIKARSLCGSIRSDYLHG